MVEKVHKNAKHVTPLWSDTRMIEYQHANEAKKKKRMFHPPWLRIHLTHEIWKQTELLIAALGNK